MPRRPRLVSALGPALLFVCAVPPAQTYAQHDLMVVELNLQGVSRTLMEVPALDGVPGLPVVELLQRLEVPIEIQELGDIISGYLGSKARRFEIDGSGTLVFQDRLHPLDESDAVWLEGELYLSLRVWREVLEMDFRFQPSRLTVTLRPDNRLPIYRRLQMERARRYRDPWLEDLDPADQWYGAETVPYSGHVLDWNVASFNLLTPSDAALSTWSVAYGGDHLGGALRASTSGSLARPLGAQGHLSWSRPFETPGLGEARFGTVASPGPAGRSMFGVVMTNAPVHPHQRFGHVDVPMSLAPHTPVDVYLDGRFIDYHDTGPGGLYDARAPLRYGHNRLEVRYLDEYGDLRSETLLFRVPRGILREGEVRYHVATGRDRLHPDLGLTSLQVGWGATRWLSVLGGSEVLVGGEDHAPGVYPYASAVARVNRQTHLQLNGSLGGHVGGLVDFASTSNIRLVASHREFQQHPILQPSTFRRETTLQLGAPFRLFDLPVGVNVSAREVHHQNGQRASQFRSTVMLRTPRAGHFVTGYQWRGDLFGLSLDEGLVFLRWSRPLPRDIIGGTVRVGIDVEPHRGRLQRASLAWGRYLMRTGGLRTEVGYQFDRDPIGLFRHEMLVSLRGHLDGAWGSSSLSVPSTGRPRLYAQSGGSVSWSDEEEAFSVHRLPQVGRGRIALRMQGQFVPAGGYVFLVDGRRYRVDENGHAAIPLLVRERTYRVFVESTSRADPLLSPRYEEIDVHVRANRTVVVDIPIDENFELEGRLYTEPAPGVRRGLGHARVELVEATTGRTRTLRTFQDGFLYDFGIPPGDWRITPDADQMTRRNLVVRPAAIRIAHRPEDGIAVHDRIDFLAGPEETMTDEALAGRVWAALLAGERDAAFSVSRILLRDRPAGSPLRLATGCTSVDPEGLERLQEGLAGLAGILVLPDPEASDCMRLAFDLGENGTSLAAEAALEETVGALVPGTLDPLRVVLPEELLGR